MKTYTKDCKGTLEQGNVYYSLLVLQKIGKKGNEVINTQYSRVYTVI